MRIISGKFRGFKFSPPMKKWPTRPTTDLTKEALFNILNNKIYFDNKITLDLFTGTGNIALEFISRGCLDITCIDNHSPCTDYIKKLAKEWDIEAEMTIINMDVFKFIKTTDRQFNFIFADPPYNHKMIDKIPDLIFKHDLLFANGDLVIETDMHTDFDDHEYLVDKRQYGDTIFWFFEKEG